MKVNPVVVGGCLMGIALVAVFWVLRPRGPQVIALEPVMASTVQASAPAVSSATSEVRSSVTVAAPAQVGLTSTIEEVSMVAPTPKTPVVKTPAVRKAEPISATPYETKNVESKASSVMSAATTGTISRTKPALGVSAQPREVARRSSLPLRREASRVSVQAGAFKSLENAQKLTSRLVSAGIKTRTVESSGFYRVIVGPYQDESTAKAAARGLAPLTQ